MTYRELLAEMSGWPADKLDCDVTIVDLSEGESFAAELSFVEPDEDGETNDFGLENNHPFFYC